MGVVRKSFKPEFLNRLDDIVMFDPLDTEDLARIVTIQLSRLNARLSDRRIAVHLTSAATEWLALTGFDPIYGARPLKRLVQTSIEDEMARKMLEGTLTDGQTVTFDVSPERDGLTIASVTSAQD